MKEILAAALLTALIAGNAQADDKKTEEELVHEQEEEQQPTIQTFIELMVGESASSLDTTIYATFTPNLYFTARGRATVHYGRDTTPSVDPLVLGLATFNVHGLGLRLELYHAAGEMRPSIGVEYMGAFGPVNILAIATIGLINKDVEGVFIGSYIPQVNDELSLYMGLEEITNFGENGHNFSQVRSRFGVCIKKTDTKENEHNFCFLAGVNLDIYGNNSDLRYSIAPAFLAEF